MMRYLFLTLLGFFGPALLMLLIRLTWFYLRAKWLRKQKKPEIIDVTPHHKKKGRKLFIFLWLLISIITTALLVWKIDDTPAVTQTYIPAHIDAQGVFVPAQIFETDKKVNP